MPIPTRSLTGKSFLVVITDLVIIQKFSIPINITTYGKISLKNDKYHKSKKNINFLVVINEDPALEVLTI